MKKLKVKVFIDGSNIYFAQKKLERWLDWVKVKKHLTNNYDVVEIRYYAGVRKNDQKVLAFLRKLAIIGFKIIQKQVKVIIDESGRKIEKANFDVEITGDIMKSIKEIEAVVLFSGDSDFGYLAELLHERAKQLYVFSSKRTLSWELKLSADKHFLIEDLLQLTKSKKFIKM